MAYYTRMADLTMRDMQRLHLAGQRLMALANALNSTGLAGKPALLQLLGEVNVEVETIFRKGVRGLANHLRRGKAPRGLDDPEFGAHIVAVMEAEAAKYQPQPAPGEAPAGRRNRAHRRAGGERARNGRCGHGTDPSSRFRARFWRLIATELGIATAASSTRWAPAATSASRIVVRIARASPARQSGCAQPMRAAHL